MGINARNLFSTTNRPMNSVDGIRLLAIIAILPVTAVSRCEATGYRNEQRTLRNDCLLCVYEPAFWEDVGRLVIQMKTFTSSPCRKTG